MQYEQNANGVRVKHELKYEQNTNRIRVVPEWNTTRTRLQYEQNTNGIRVEYEWRTIRTRIKHDYDMFSLLVLDNTVNFNSVLPQTQPVFSPYIIVFMFNRLVSWEEYLREKALYILAERPNYRTDDVTEKNTKKTAKKGRSKRV